VDRARGRAGDSWEVRRLAALMLQYQAWTIPASDLAAHASLFERLGIAPRGGSAGRVSESVLAEGYSTAELRGFIREFRRRIGRAARVFVRLRGAATPPAAWRDFLELARSECRLALARHLFTPAEVVDRVLGQVRVSSGVGALFSQDPALAEEEAGHLLARLPPYEASILRRLAGASRIYWAGKRTGERPNALVEQPRGTVVLVVKPPGSELEIEVKRAGRPRDLPLGIVFRRDGVAVPAAHRLDGGSTLDRLQWEARAAALLSRIYRLVHGAEAPLSRTVSLTSIYSIPARERDWHTLDYFTDPEAFGEEFPRMRAALAEAAGAFDEETEGGITGLEGDLGLTVQFLHLAPPAQAVLCGSTAFRLDRLAGYFAEEGREPAWAEARHTADELLEEVLGEYEPPAARWYGRRSYLRAAFSMPANRAAADRAFRGALCQLGTLWGTLSAVRGYSRGESFVGRNVGLKSSWAGGRWRVGIIFMDHDGLSILGHDQGVFHPLRNLSGMQEDERHILGSESDGLRGKGEVDYLREVYRIGEAGAGRGRVVLRRAMRHAYRATHAALAASPELARLFAAPFAERIRDWDDVARERLRGMRGGGNSWRARVRRLLADRGYQADLIEEHVEGAERYSDFLARQAFLYRT
jgi:hypothetical protein